MDLIRSFIKNDRIIYLIMIAAILIFGHGCGDNTKITVVDFSKTVSVERPEDRTPEYPPLRVSVAAMISPKETFIYYRQLLNYIGDKLDR